MTAPLFFVDADAIEGSERRDRILLDGPEGRHAARVRRLQVGERVDVADGAGRRAECVVSRIDRDAVELTVQALASEPEPPLRVVVVQALAKGNRAEQAVELLTEVGVDVVVPWAAERSIVRWDDTRIGKALARWREIARQAAKQARRARIPEVSDLASSPQVADRLAGCTLGLLLHEEAPASLAETVVPAQGELVVVVGPEGGLSRDEVRTFRGAGALAVRMGPTVLRTSTAGVAAAAVLLARSGRWG